MIPGLQRAFKVRVEIKFRAVSCPGVHLPAKEDVYLSVFVTGQYHQSECLPAVFPLLFQEKMTFEKIFRYAFDPGDVAVMLEHETVRVELVQLIPPAGHLLASFEENTRNFLFPEPKLVPPFSGLDREALMVRAPYFPGIAPRLEFSTKTSITQCLPDSETSIYPNVLMRPETHRKRCPSRRRRMASPEGKPPQTHRGRRAGSADPHSTARRQSLSPLRRRTGWKTNTSQPAGQIPQEDSGSLGRFGSAGTEYSPDPSALLWPNRKPPGSESRSHRVWEEVHERVRGLLTTPRAVRRLIYVRTMTEMHTWLSAASHTELMTRLHVETKAVLPVFTCEIRSQKMHAGSDDL